MADPTLIKLDRHASFASPPAWCCHADGVAAMHLVTIRILALLIFTLVLLHAFIWNSYVDRIK
jgi:hypothetical protein